MADRLQPVRHHATFASKGCCTHPGQERPSAHRVERPELVDLLAGDHRLGEEATGDRAEGDAPHAVTTRGEHARGLRCTDERQAVDGAGTRPDPLVLAVVEVGAAQQRASGLRDGLDAALVERGIMKQEAGDIPGARADWVQVLVRAPEGPAADVVRNRIELLEVPEDRK